MQIDDIINHEFYLLTTYTKRDIMILEAKYTLGGTNMFRYFEKFTTSQRAEIEKQLLSLYENSRKDCLECEAAYDSKKTPKNKLAFFESVQRLGAIVDVFETMHLTYGKSLDD